MTYFEVRRALNIELSNHFSAEELADDKMKQIIELLAVALAYSLK
ncbi:Uncharacterised protein [Acinetobacter baumannii]|uniref:Uncharacterized protein n=1 Tax=Acinetobacter phage AbTZA1 TaxID=2500827 RepID=A0A3Q9R7C7_9CAUD|nr:hypothetical protein HYP74_gp055 [Acinetobacter phage AbTZA1]AZU98775.1 hypothetical protein [Acinetobacter phage AbTZA1]QQO96743.1 hypothetical protein CPT_Melin_042 [Acinetobacter phage Melin]SSU39409.1 Uncharacterised protein [Acinetobacter baumannii]